MEITLSTVAIGHIKIKTTSKKQYNKNERTKMITLYHAIVTTQHRYIT
jgi:hypothetical protein